MAFGLSFGAKKQKGSQTVTVDKDELTTGTQTTDKTGSQFGQTSTSQTGQTSSTGQQNTSQQSSQSTSGSESGRTTGTVTSLGADVQTALSDTVKRILAGGVTDSNMASLSNAIAGVSSFDPAKFVQQNVTAARTRGEQTLQETNSARQGQIGGTAATNSMAALLASRGRNDLEASIAGVEANATATAEQIRAQNLQAASGAQSQLTGQAVGLSDVLKGATSTTDQTTLTQQLQQLLGEQKGSTTSAESGTSAQQQNTQTLEILNELVNALVNQNVSTTGTEKTKSKGSSFGGGVSAGF